MKAWTKEEDDLILALHAERKSRSQIAAHFGVTRNMICGKLFRLNPPKVQAVMEDPKPEPQEPVPFEKQLEPQRADEPEPSLSEPEPFQRTGEPGTPYSSEEYAAYLGWCRASNRAHHARGAAAAEKLGFKVGDSVALTPSGVAHYKARHLNGKVGTCVSFAALAEGVTVLINFGNEQHCYYLDHVELSGRRDALGQHQRSEE